MKKNFQPTSLFSSLLRPMSLLWQGLNEGVDWLKRRDFFAFPAYSLPCGIAGFLDIATTLDFEKESSFFEKFSLRGQGIEALIANEIVLDAYAGGGILFEKCQKLARMLTELEGRYFLLQQSKLRQRIGDVIQEIERFLKEEEQLRERYATQISLKFLEEINRRLIQLKDFHWQFKVDILGNVEKILALGAMMNPSESMGRHYARLNAILNMIDRLEIRGRDSAGVGILVVFPSLLARDAFLKKCFVYDRVEIPDFASCSIRILADTAAISLTYKCAKAVGQLGENVKKLRALIQADTFLASLLAEKEVQVQIFSHTRWASNGIISEPNCHPVDNQIYRVQEEQFAFLPLKNAHYPNYSQTHIQVMLNGDIDNYQQLRIEFEKPESYQISPQVTTDAKIIAHQIEKYLHQGFRLQEAFRLAFNDFEGSFAIAMMSDLEPSRIFLGVRGSGQGLYIGLLEKGYNFASEIYGIVEETSRYISLDGHAKSTQQMCKEGQLVILDQNSSGGLESIQSFYCDGSPSPALSVKRAEITTRDIDRQNFEHFFYKEITSAPISVRNTLRGKFEIRESEVLFNLGEEVFPKRWQEAFLQKKIKKIYLVGQGTASIAATAIAYLFQEYLVGTTIQIYGMKASELSGMSLPDEMSDCLVIAVSQSGTTTDTNRAVDMLSERGAYTACIVNRRNSQLTEKVEGIFFTSDGRDVEMSVASTKAFYAQVVAGALYGLKIAQILQTLDIHRLKELLTQWNQLPQLMQKVLDQQKTIVASAEQYGVTRVNWAVVGSGANFIAAQEIRIKLSELCYKSISCDLVEDKKHIDLSSEPLILVLAAGAKESISNDLVKEVGIFRAHKSVPIVVNFEGNRDFDAYAVAVISIPKCPSELAMILNTMVGHLWGYAVAKSINQEGLFFQEVRDEVGKLRSRLLENPESEEEVLQSACENFSEYEISFWERMKQLRFNSSLSLKVGTEIASLLHWLGGGTSFEHLRKIFRQTFSSPLVAIDQTLAILNQAIEDLFRPIDAIKHQAKTVTVGTSRLESFPEGVLAQELQKLKVLPEQLTFQNRSRLKFLQETVEKINGWTLYQLANLDRLGNPTEQTTISIVQREGVSKTIPSRTQKDSKLQGTKWYVVHHKMFTVGQGQRDKRFIAILPIQQSDPSESFLLLFHLTLKENLPLRYKTQILQKFEKFEEVKTICEELGVEWKEELLESFSPQQLFTTHPLTLAQEIVSSEKKRKFEPLESKSV